MVPSPVHGRESEKTVYEGIYSLEYLAASFDPRAKYFKLSPVDVKPIVQAIKDFDDFKVSS